MLVPVLTALGLMLAIEGALYALLPGQMRAMAAAVQRMPDDAMRKAGLLSVVGGVCVIWLVQRVFT
jgi:uncharacterized protein